MADIGRKPRVAIVGAGFGGIGTAIALLRAGYDDLVILEKSEAVGGVWRDNTYPGICCDIPAPLYSFSFAPNPDWSRRYPPRDEILAYLRDVATRHGVDPYVRLGVTVHEAAWDADARRWVLDTSDGDVVADVLVTATGQLSVPRLPALPGMDSFTGPSFHTAQWRQDVDVAGKRVAVVGTGASAIQIVPRIAGVASQVTVFQRTPPWALFKADHAYSAPARALRRRLPGIMSLGRLGTWGLAIFLGSALVGNPLSRVAVSALARAQLRLQVPDRELRRKLTPDYPIGCKRLVFTGEWYPALQRDDVRLVTEAVTEVLPNGVRSADGEKHPCDVLVYATGFDAGGFVAPMTVRGAGGVALDEVWKDGAHAYLGMTVPDFPNLFIVYGPNTNTGSTSVLYFEESQAAYIAQAVASIERDGPLDVRTDVADTYDAEIQSRLAESVWVTCSSWYRTPSGRVVTNWPGTAEEYRARTRTMNRADYKA